MKKERTTPINQLPPLTGIRVLMAEDNEINGILACRFMEIWGVKCDLAPDGLSAFEKVQSKDYDLVFMDLQMPGMDGYQASQNIRGLPDPYFKKIPIIAITASTISDIRKKALSHGINDIVEKPFNLVDLHRKIRLYSKTILDPTV